MCDPLTLLAVGGSVLSGVMGLGQSAPTPPKAAVPAVAAPTARNGGATVLVGDGKTDLPTDTSTTASTGFTEKRKSGVALGGLGRSGLAL